MRAAEWATEPLSPLGATTTFVSMIEARKRKFSQREIALVHAGEWLALHPRRLPTAPDGGLPSAIDGAVGGREDRWIVWTPLFNIASAAVTEVGGPFFHAAIVAREFGIPLVTGAIEATHVITDGTPIVVDGSSGIVEL